MSTKDKTTFPKFPVCVTKRMMELIEIRKSEGARLIAEEPGGRKREGEREEEREK